MQGIPSYFARADVGLVSQAPVLLNKFILRTMGRIHIIVSLLGVTKEKHQLLTNHSQIKRRVDRVFTSRFGQAVKQIELYNIDAILKNFRRNIGSSTPFF